MIYTTGTSRPPTGGQGTRKCQSKAAIRQQRSAQIHLPNRSEGQAHFACHFHAGHKMCSPWVHLDCVNPSQSALTRCAFSTTKIRWPVFDNAIAAVSDQLHHLNKRLQHDTGTWHPETASPKYTAQSAQAGRVMGRRLLWSKRMASRRNRSEFPLIAHGRPSADGLAVASFPWPRK